MIEKLKLGKEGEVVIWNDVIRKINEIIDSLPQTSLVSYPTVQCQNCKNGCRMANNFPCHCDCHRPQTESPQGECKKCKGKGGVYDPVLTTYIKCDKCTPQKEWKDCGHNVIPQSNIVCSHCLKPLHEGGCAPQSSWEEDFDKRFLEEVETRRDDLSMISLKNFIHTEIQKAEERGRKQEESRWINQPTNEHDERIRLAERTALREKTLELLDKCIFEGLVSPEQRDVLRAFRKAYILLLQD